ncbi:hypothetical protein [Streptomyces peucetius]|uniref:Rad50/SbcC-type AAA domain-containing protein n=1 Tax=Streptomyces peucetius TaxID=1950 RepID=A0ABY6I6R5_STRPE|nr:hypothetical protein [Streptomyces peucetius]UYQ62697.1 hypothetical protein OGH68_15210 [Streptomyces peucetius]
MKTRIRAVKLRVHSTAGPAGATVKFGPGLNVLRASNSRGKTQSLQAIVYSLGLESMFGPNSGTSLGSALTNQISYGEPESAASVKSSWCAVELENPNGIITVQRAVKNSRVQPNLVRVWRGPAITEGAADLRREEYFVRESGSAKNPRGFHRFLAEYLGWSLPSIPKYTGGEALLYPEIIFPFLYADQRSWGSAGPRPVTHYQLREPTRRAAEFLLGFAGPETAAQRYRLEDQIKKLRSDWATKLAAVQATASAAGGRVVGLPELPAGARSRSGSRPTRPTSTAESRLQVLVDEEWVSDEELLQSLREAAIPGPAPQVTDVGHDLIQSRLSEQESELTRLTTMAKIVEQNLTLNERQVAILDERITAMSDEKLKNQDVKTLLRLGSSSEVLNLDAADCPTCHQPLSNVEAGHVGPVLDVDATISLLSSQIRTFEEMRRQARESATESRVSYRAIQRAVDICRMQIKALQDDLVVPGDFPSSGDIAKRVAAEVLLFEFTRARDAVQDLLSEMQGLADSVFEVRTELSNLPNVTPQEDYRRRDILQKSVREQLTDFGFSSYDAALVSIDEETLRPEREGLNLDTDASASDVVRTKIAYLNGIREVANSLRTQHPGFLLLDEPRQHELDEDHFRATLRRLAQCSDINDQVIATSAASVSALSVMLGSAQANVIDLGSQRLIRPATSEDPMDY